jgi:di/tricarboxylate transporter
MYLTLGIFAIAIVLFITEWLRVDVVTLSVVVVLLLTEILSRSFLYMRSRDQVGYRVLTKFLLVKEIIGLFPLRF